MYQLVTGLAAYGRFLPAWVAIFLTALSATASAQTFTFTDLYTLSLPAGYSDLHIDLGVKPISASGVAVGRAAYGNKFHALLWSGSSSAINLTPAGFAASEPGSTNGVVQVGHGAPSAGGNDHALLWNNSNTAVDLHPAGYQMSVAVAASGSQQVGYGFHPSLGYRALLWSGNNTPIDLTPPGFISTFPRGTDGVQQIGQGHSASTGNRTHALLWSGTNSVIDLNPEGFTESYGLNVNAGKQVGYGKPTGNLYGHALLWNGSNAGVDLNPIGFVQSVAIDTDGTYQVGYGSTSTSPEAYFRALLWKGTNEAIDLGALLPANFARSYAFSLDATGSVYGMAFDTAGNWHAVKWTPVPEPSGMLLLLMLGAIASRRRAPK